MIFSTAFVANSFARSASAAEGSLGFALTVSPSLTKRRMASDMVGYRLDTPPIGRWQRAFRHRRGIPSTA
jgi:hypothetical protein